MFAVEGKPRRNPLSMVLTIQMFMLLAGALIIIFTKTARGSTARNEVFRACMVTVIAAFGIAWMADTVLGANLPALKASLAGGGCRIVLDAAAGL